MNHLPYDESDLTETDPLVTPKTSKGNLIRLSDFYKDYCGTPEYVEVSDEVLTFLIESKREEQKIRMRDYRHLAACGFDEIEAAVCAGVYVDSAEDIFFEKYQKEEIYAIFRKLKPEVFRRFYLYYAVGLTIQQVAEAEGISHTAVSKSVKKAKAELKKLLCDIDKENT